MKFNIAILFIVFCAILSSACHSMDVFTCRTFPQLSINKLKIAGKKFIFIAENNSDEAQIRNLSDGKLVATLHHYDLSDIEIGDTTIVTWSDDVIKGWNFDGTCLYKLKDYESLRLIKATQNNLIILNGNEIEIRDLNSGKLLKTFNPQQTDIEQIVMADNKFITVTHRSMRIWSFDGTCLGTIDHGATHVKVMNDKLITTFENVPAVNIWDLKGKRVGTLLDHHDRITQIEIGDNKIIASARDQRFIIWHSNGRCMLSTICDLNFAFLIENQALITACGNYVFIHNLAGDLYLNGLRHNDPVCSVAVANGKIFTATATSGIIKVWDLNSGDHLLDLPCHLKSPKLTLANNRLLIYSTTEPGFQLWADSRPQQRALAVATAMHSRCGRNSPANGLCPDLAQTISEHAMPQPWSALTEPIVEIRKIMGDSHSEERTFMPAPLAGDDNLSQASLKYKGLYDFSFYQTMCC